MRTISALVSRKMAKLISIALLLAINGVFGGVIDNEVWRSLYEDEPKNLENHWALIVAGSNGWYNYRHQV